MNESLDSNRGRSRQSNTNDGAADSGREIHGDLNESRIELLVAQAADEFYNETRQGAQPDIEEYVKRYPEISHIIRDVFAGLANLENSAAAKGKTPDLINHRLGDFQIQEEIGRGGMGIVYSAIQLSIGRQVALKVLPFAATLDELQLNRFKHEVRAIGMLNHPHIVPIYAVGQERGVHFFAMQLIEGQSMADLIVQLQAERVGKDLLKPTQREKAGDTATHRECVENERAIDSTGPDTCRGKDSSRGKDKSDGAAGEGVPSETVRNANQSTLPHSMNRRRRFQSIARLGKEAAEALAHAHQGGVVHRDIKPANLMIDKTGKLWITDFGLARTEDRRSLTVPGDLVGTMRYMSPEQAEGEGLVDQRTDVYSLGASLYELITLRPAVEGNNRQTILKAVINANPILPRKIEPAIPGSLELVIRKAIEKNPEDRYSTAEAFADDLGRFLADKPILARRSSLIDRTRKWVRRRPTTVASALGLLTVAAIVLATSMFFVLSAQKSTAGALEAEKQQRQRADANLRFARDFIHRIYLNESERLGMTPGLSDEQHKFFEAVVQFYDNLPKSETGSSGVRQEAAQAHLRLADAQRHLGQHEPAIEDLKKAESLLTKLLDEKASDKEIRFIRATGRMQLGNAYSHIKAMDDAKGVYRKALQDLAETTGAGEPEWQHELYRALVEKSLASAESSLGYPKIAAPLFETAAKRIRDLRDRFPDVPEVRFQVVVVHSQFASFLHRTHGDPRAAKVYRAAIGEAELLLQKDPNNVRAQTLVARLYNDFANLAPFSIAKDYYSRSVKIWESASQRFPDRPAFRKLLATTQANLGTLLNSRQEHAEALKWYRQAETIMTGLLADSPGSPVYGTSLAQLKANMGNAFQGLRRREECERIRGEVIQQWKSLNQRFPNRPSFRAELAMAHYSLAKTTTDLNAAHVHLEEAISVLRPLANEFPDTRNYLHRLTSCLNVLGKNLKNQGKNEEAIRAFEEAIQIAEQLHLRWPSVPDYVGKLARRHRSLGEFYLQSQQPSHAADEFRKAIEYREQLATDFAEYVDSVYINPMASLYGLLGAAILRHDPENEELADSYFRKMVERAAESGTFKSLSPQLRYLTIEERDRIIELIADFAAFGKPTN